MKQTIKYIMFILAVALSVTAMSQNAKQDQSGNYVAVKTAKSKEPGKATGKTFTDSKGNKYPVMESSRGKLYYIKTSKTGNDYKVYLKF